MTQVIAPARACWLSQQIYAPIVAGIFDQVLEVGGITVGISHGVSHESGVTEITFAGSEKALDWLRNFRAIPYEHPRLGTVHLGFWSGMGDVFVALRPYLIGTIAIQGHSLGGAHAAILAGLCAINGIEVAQLTLFAPPRPGFAAIRNLIAGTVPCVLAYRNGLDPVPTVAPHIPVLFPWEDVAPLISLNEPPPEPPTAQADETLLDELESVFQYHEISLYLKALAQDSQEFHA